MQASTQATRQAAKQLTTMPVNVPAPQAATHWGMAPIHHQAKRRVRAVIAVWVALLVLALGVADRTPFATAQISHAQSAADIAPADAGVFVEINNIKSLRVQIEKDPLWAYFLKALPEEQNRNWAAIQALMQMNGQQIVDRYFGQTIAIIGQSTGNGSPAVFATRASKADVDNAIQRLSFVERPEHKRKHFKVYSSSDDKAIMVTGLDWVLLADKSAGKFLEKTVDNIGSGKSLADNPTYRAAIAQLPAKRDLTAFARDPMGQHALSARYDKGELSVHYAGQSTVFMLGYGKLKNAKPLAFGPLPQSTLGAMTLNAIADPPKHQKATRVMDRMLAPKTFTGDVLPGIDAPTVLFYGGVPGDQIAPLGEQRQGEQRQHDPKLAVPAMGLAVKLKDHAVADHLTTLLDKFMILANAATIQWDTDPVVLSKLDHKGHKYHSANVGVALSQRSRRPEFAAMTLTYGRIGDWYVLCSQDGFYRQCLEAHDEPAKRLTQSQAFKDLQLKSLEGSDATAIAAGMVQTRLLAAHLMTWLEIWKQEGRPSKKVALDKTVSMKRVEPKFVEGMGRIVDLLSHFETVSLQSYRSKDNVLHAELRFRRPK